MLFDLFIALLHGMMMAMPIFSINYYCHKYTTSQRMQKRKWALSHKAYAHKRKIVIKFKLSAATTAAAITIDNRTNLK